jgi:hypothetical protein
MFSQAKLYTSQSCSS